MILPITIVLSFLHKNNTGFNSSECSYKYSSVARLKCISLIVEYKISIFFWGYYYENLLNDLYDKALK